MQAIHQPLHRQKQVEQSSSQTPGPNRGKKPDFRAMVQNKEMQSALGSGLLMLIAWGTAPYFGTLSIMLYIVAYAVGGWTKAKDGIETLVKDRDLDVNLLMIAASLGAAAIGYWNEGAMLIFIFALSGALESYATERSHKDISSLLALKPETALRIEDGQMNLVAIDDLQPGDLLLVKPGELIPADGVVYRGSSFINQSSITGESLPVDKVAGDEVYAGTVNGEGALYVEVTKSAEGSLFGKIIKMVEEAQAEVPDSQRFMERFEGIYARIVVGVTLLVIAGTPLLLGWTWNEAFYKAMVFLVVASPCALVSSIMPVMLSAMSSSARRGILFKGGAHMENMARTQVVAFDKTGTLTMGTPQVTDIITAENVDRAQLLAAVAAIENLSMHPLARAIVDQANMENITLQEAEHVQALTGWGIEGTINGVVWSIGKTGVLGSMQSEEMKDSNVGDPDEHGVNHVKVSSEWGDVRSRLEGEGKTVSVVMADGELVGLIAMRDTVRPQAAAAVKKLEAMGVKVAMLTGDRARSASVIARETGVSMVYADLLPEDKVEKVQVLRKQYGPVLMVGDGVNDAPALAAATVGMGMGLSGSGTALEVADAVLMNDNIEEIAWVIGQARRAQRTVKQNMFFAITVILALIAGNFLQDVALPLGVVGHEGSTILVILNGLRLLR
ncbi:MULTISPECIES: heavy metal translocating P-type ATPase [unclassified Paenibacillus]|uniref:heavy metal translocating P-type ATPase n=1 Tax=unclassified Paenibacillus TaxID=185978 RepID=UPI000CFB61DD|nr:MULTISPECIES: heavy metal translocating P-type ATPase [unclassified Paenibacillus]PQZ99803.1 heavy metal translocating P-type ATPase [Paenibacillus sp. MYb63]PRA44198.1 heavy metal translocating P-type ATPase [Paenibacillus sp. MYb67]QZN76312.1 heavy metal translocating P-type ATPase [Paenibacillus sp. DR312]